MDDLIVAGVTIPWSDFEERFETSGGPGGQHANRSSTAVRLRFDVEASSLSPELKQRVTQRLGPVVEVVSAEERSQLRNRKTARARMAARLEGGLARPKRRKPTRPTRASKQRRRADKEAHARTKRLRRRPDEDR